MNSPQEVTFKKIAFGINPEWDLKNWIQWPPDMFALCATIINRTGAYKLLLMDPLIWNNPSWTNDIKTIARAWVRYSNSLLLKNAPAKSFLNHPVFSKHFEVLLNDWISEDSVKLDHVRVLGNIYKVNALPSWKKVEAFTQSLLFMYILADSCCEGLGFLGQPLAKQNLSHRNFFCVANLLLINTGSLSTIPKFHGVVLPKMRTPQAGMVPRSVTHYLTFHATEVEVFWRTFPWLEQRNKSLNILAVPYPYEVKSSDFELIGDNYQSVRYFKANVSGREVQQAFLQNLVEKVLELSKENKQVDILVFPEMSLSDNEYKFLLKELHHRFLDAKCLARLPIIVAGVMSNYVEKTINEAINDTFLNEVRLAIHFSGKWHSNTQRKHHRWQLDRNQIRQYELEGHFTADSLWFEYCTVSQRRLTILAPNDWLALTALICEDLARQEPVGEVIRGIGPTLLMALLSDGPQLKGRWSARYASVLADDPGTAVLSLTSKGMMERSKSEDPKVNEAAKPIIGLWKDMVNSWSEFELKEKGKALLFTISSKYREEYTLDGRSDRKFASVFQLDSQFPESIEIETENNKAKVSPALDDIISSNNLRELSAIQFVIDALIDILSSETREDIDKGRGNIELSKDFLLTLLQGKKLSQSDNNNLRSRIADIISRAWKEPHSVGISASAATQSEEEMKVTAGIIQKIIQGMSATAPDETAQFYEELIHLCKDELSVEKLKFEHKQVYMSILYNLFNRMVNWQPKSSKNSTNAISGMNVSKAIKLKADILEIVLNN
ncbi:hypothetical protein [Pedobacter sp. D749]|uniref:hypothetical protein n=1 Tax=Pedobacter sp. D749 TaxID=2856523 RepID=UPI001C59C4F1|nr:hypothetical protein [Pedobacter sp. D749]QXU42804.1 hypothetical protein KYH19_04175 [Pedobacter sp. D749]